MADLVSNQIPKYAITPNGGVALIQASSNTVTPGVDTNGVACYTAGANGGRVYGLFGNTNDTVAVNVVIYLLNGSTVKPLALVNVPLSSGVVAGVLNVNMLLSSVFNGLPVDNAGNRYIPLMPNEILKVGALANLTAAKTCWVTSVGSDY